MNLIAKRVILIHGWGGSPGHHWKPWLTKELQAKGFEVVEPQMPHTDTPVFSEWLAKLSEVVGTPDENTFIVGHSLGCVTVVRYVASLLGETKVGGVVLVAGFYTDINRGEKIRDFYTTQSEIEKAKEHCDKFVSIGSDTDEDVPMEKVAELNDALDGKLLVEKNKGHFCEEDGVTELPSALDAILEMVGTA